MKIEITNSEFLLASQVGLMRYLKGKRNEGESKIEGFTPDIIGALGEFAICKYIGAFWVPGVGRFDKNDIPGFTRPIDVKTRARNGHTPDLAIIAQTTGPKKYRGFDLIFCNYTYLCIEVLGYMPAEEYFDKAELKFLKEGRSDVWQLPINQLYKFEDFVNLEPKQLLK